MKLLFCLLLSVTGAISLQDFVEEFHALKLEKTELKFIEKYKSSKSVAVKAYVYAVQMKQAEHTMNPIKKIKIFKKYKNQFDALIKANPTNVHARYMRLVIQEKMPSFMGYNNFIAEDKKILKRYLSGSSKKTYLEQYIKKNTSL